ncbi:MAG: PH domain-containing protein [Anaerolineae bacterium]
MGYSESLMGREENIVFMTRQQWIVLVGSVVVNGFFLAAIVAADAALNLSSAGTTLLTLLPLVLLIIPLTRLAIRFLNWWNEQYIITNRRVVQTEGVINKHVIDSSLEKVNDVVLNQSVLGRVLGYGDLEILTASEFGVNRFGHITQPVRFKTEMLNHKQKMGALNEFGRKAERTLGTPTPTGGDIPELIAELDELRKKGIISEPEFQEKKQELLRKI